MSSWSVEHAVQTYLDGGFHDGDLLSHDWIMFLLDVTDRDIQADRFILLDRMDAFRQELLRTHRIALANVRGKGYRIVPPDEQAEFAARTMSDHITRGMQKASDLLQYTRREALDVTAARRHTDTEVRVAALRGLISKGKRDVWALFRPERRIENE